MRLPLVPSLLAVALLASPLHADPADSTWMDHYRATRAALVAHDPASARLELAHVRMALGEQPGVLYQAACAGIEVGDTTAALAKLGAYAASGMTRDLATDSAFVSLWSDPRYRALVARLRANAGPVSGSTTLLTVADPGLLVEDLAFDPHDKAYYVSSVRRGIVCRLGASGAIAQRLAGLAPAGFGAFALGIDAPHRRLWVGLAALKTCDGYAPADSGRSQLVCWDLAAGKVTQRLECAHDGHGHLLGDMTIGADGTVYVSDGPAGAVYRVRPNADSLEVVVAAGAMDNPQTPALSADGRRLYVSDYSRGIASVDLGSDALSWVSFPAGVALQGIDGMVVEGRTITAVQNGTRPERIARFQLDEAGERVLSGRSLEQASPGLGEPTHGVFVGDRFVFIANSGWDRVGDDEHLRDAPLAKGAQLRALPRR